MPAGVLSLMEEEEEEKGGREEVDSPMGEEEEDGKLLRCDLMGECDPPSIATKTSLHKFHFILVQSKSGELREFCAPREERE